MSTPNKPALSLRARSVTLLLCAAVMAFTSGAAQAISKTDLYNINTNTGFYDPTTPDCGDAATTTSNETGNASLSLGPNQVAIAKTIIGIAKTDNLGQAGALVGMMVALAESGLKIYANKNVPISEGNPAKQATGSDHDSLGVFQQRISTGWSTISNDPNNHDAVYQLMDPAYNAEAFFGSPPGSNAPRPLSKGLQNVSGWQSMDPWLAAQKTQISAYDGRPRAANNYSSEVGGNYKKLLGEAQKIIARYYDEAQPVTLPVPISRGASGEAPAIPGGNTCAVLTSYQCNTPAPTAKILCEAQKYKGIWYQFGAGHDGRSAYVRGCPDPTHPPDNQSGGKSGNPSPCALDCSSLVSMAVDDAFGTKFNWTVGDIEADSKDWQSISISQAQPGDVVTMYRIDSHGNVDQHVEILVSYDASKKTVQTFGAHHTGTQVGPTQASADYYNHGAWHYKNPTGSVVAL